MFYKVYVTCEWKRQVNQISDIQYSRETIYDYIHFFKSIHTFRLRLSPIRNNDARFNNFE